MFSFKYRNALNNDTNNTVNKASIANHTYKCSSKHFQIWPTQVAEFSYFCFIHFTIQ